MTSSLIGRVAFSIIGMIYLTVLTSLLGLLFAGIRLFKLGPRRFFSKLERPKPPLRAVDSEYGRHEMIKLKSSDVTLHYVSKGTQDQPLMLFVHGFPECWYSWRFQLKYFSNKYRVVALDTRGYGLSSKPSRIADYTLQVLARDIADIIEQLGYKSCILVGHDFGGAISWITASLFPHLIEKLIIMNCPHPQTFQSDMTLAQLKRSWYMFYHQCPMLPELIIQSDDFGLFKRAFLNPPMGLVNTNNMDEKDIEVFKYTFAQKGTPKAALNYYRAMFRYQPDQLFSVAVPALLLWGTKDGAIGEELCHATTKYCSNLKIKKLPDASHWVQQDQPAEINKYMEAFLNEHT